jgi:hypothetical protein
LEEGNTRPPPKRKYCFTLNNYGEDKNIDQITDEFDKLEAKYIIGKETAKTGTKHLQGYVEFKNKKAFSTIKKILPKAHIEGAKGTRNQNIKYCSKESVYACNMVITTNASNLDIRKSRYRKKHIPAKWYPWQEQVIQLLNGKADDRKVVYIYDPQGGNGKSYLAKWIYLNYCHVVICGGKENDVFNQLNGMLEDIPPDDEIDVIILDVPRNGYVNYQLIEKLKNGLLYSGKYEGGVCIFEPPHVVIFSNEAPKLDQFTKDRWNIVQISDPIEEDYRI